MGLAMTRSEIWLHWPQAEQVNGLGWRSQRGHHAHGKVTDEGCLGDFHIKSHFPGFVSTVDHLAGDDVVGKARGDFTVDFQTPDGHTINRLK